MKYYTDIVNVLLKNKGCYPFLQEVVQILESETELAGKYLLP